MLFVAVPASHTPLHSSIHSISTAAGPNGRHPFLHQKLRPYGIVFVFPASAMLGSSDPGRRNSWRYRHAEVSSSPSGGVCCGWCSSSLSVSSSSSHRAAAATVE